jgi:hypothetical protein
MEQQEALHLVFFPELNIKKMFKFQSINGNCNEGLLWYVHCKNDTSPLVSAKNFTVTLKHL